MSRTRDFADLINGISAAKITSGTFADARLSSSSVTQHVDLSSIDSDYVQARQATADLSNLNASNLTSGTVPNARITLDAAEIPDLPTSKITSGTLGADRIPSLDAGKITSGAFSNARISSGSVTQHVSAVNSNVGSWSPGYHNFACTTLNADYVRVGRFVSVTLYFKCTGYTATSNKVYISGLPYTSLSSGDPAGTGFVSGSDITNKSYGCFVHGNSTAIYLRGADGRKTLGSADGNATLRGHDAEYLSQSFRGTNECFHTLTLNYISIS